MKRECYVAIDFDGVCVTHAYPKVGADVGADVWLRPAVALGAKLILDTMRAGAELDDALEWFHSHGIKLWAVNTNPDQELWTDCTKIFAHAYINSATIGIPMRPRSARRKPHVDWDIVGPLLLKRVAGAMGVPDQ